jgi:hypothetical protein
MTAQSANPKTFQMPTHGWVMIKRLLRAYGAAQDDDKANVEAVAKLAGVPRPSVSSNNNFLRSIGLLEMDRPKLAPLGVKLATGIAVENTSIIVEALQEVVRTTPVLNQLLNTLRARGSMDQSAFRGQVILAAGLKANSPSLATIKTLFDLFEESQLIELRDDKIALVGSVRLADNGSMSETPQVQEVSQPNFSEKIAASIVAARANQSGMVDALLSKFPDLNPDWPDDIKNKWFDAFDRLMKGRGL